MFGLLENLCFLAEGGPLEQVILVAVFANIELVTLLTIVAFASQLGFVLRQLF